MSYYIGSCVLSLSLLHVLTARSAAGEDAVVLFQGEMKYRETPLVAGALEELSPEVAAPAALQKARQAREDAERRSAEVSHAEDHEERLKQRAAKEAEKRARMEALRWETVEREKREERKREERKLQTYLSDAGAAQIADMVEEGQNKATKRSGKSKKDDPVDDTADAMGNISVEDIVELLNSLTNAMKEPGFTKGTDAAIKELQALVATFAQQNEELDLEFVVQGAIAEQDDFVPLIAKYFNETLDIERAHSEQAGVIQKKLQAAMPEELSDAISPLMSMLAPATFTVPSFDYAKFKATPPTEVCSQINAYMTTLEDYQANLTKVHGLLNTTANMVPMLEMFLPDTPKKVSAFLEDLLNLGYVETIAREKAIDDCTSMVGPVITEKLQCQWDSAAPQLGLGLLAALASLLVVWPAL